MPKDAFYFPHDYNASRDPKMVKLIRLHGYEAFGLYWAIVERLYENGGRISEDYEMIAYELRVDVEKIKTIIQSDLFFIADGMVGSYSVDRRLDARRERSDAARASASRRWQGNANAMPTHSEPYARKKEKKEKKETQYGGIFDAWREYAPNLSQPKDLTPKRLAAARARWNDNPNLKYWQDVIKRVAASDFCCGGGSTGWKADIDWLLRPDTSTRVLEGKYDNKGVTDGGKLNSNLFA